VNRKRQDMLDRERKRREEAKKKVTWNLVLNLVSRVFVALCIEL
jgi:hypothetical protein